jgi:hypothetical protein
MVAYATLDRCDFLSNKNNKLPAGAEKAQLELCPTLDCCKYI